MKKTILLLTVFFSISLTAQDKKYPMPDFDNVPYFYDETNNSLIPLEKANYHLETKAKGLFGAGLYIVVPGATAKLRYSNTQKIQFIIHFDDARTEPSTLFQLIPLTINTKNNNNQREYMAKSQGLGHSETNETQIAMNPKKIGDGLYLLTFAGEIVTGEYALTIEKTKQGYSFGIDGDAPINVVQSDPKRPKEPIAGAIYDKIQKDKAEKAAKEQAQQPTQSSKNSTSISDEIIKLKKLLDDGIINQQEFDTQKKKLLEGN